VTNVALHLACCALVFALARRAGATPLAAALGASLFGLFPRLTESVSWVSGRTDVLASCFGLLTLLLHAGEPERLGRRCAAAVALFLGLLAKEVAVAALAGVVVLELARASRAHLGWRRVMIGVSPAVVATVAYGALRLAALGEVPRGAIDGVPAWARWLMPLQALGRYALMLADPLRPRLRIGLFGEVDAGLAALGLAVAVAISVGVHRLLRRPADPVVTAALATGGVALAMVLHLVPIRLGTLTADRFLYLPVAGLAVAMAGAAGRLAGRPARAALAAALVAVPAFGCATVIRNEAWQDEVLLWQSAVASADQRDAIPWNELGNALGRADRLDEALRVFELLASRTVGSARVDALGNVAGTLSDLGRHAEARDRFAELVGLEPERPLHLYNLGLADARLLRFNQADAELSRAIELFPDYDGARQARAIVHDVSMAWEALPPAAPDEPTRVRARRAEVWSKLGAPDRASPLWRAVALAPDATASDLTQAAAFLASRGSASEAHAAIARARAAGAPAGKVSDMETVLAQRNGARPAP
jgi:tetratricopeptide (TPR) repeat protein